jgi:hypothetical protein
VELIVMHVCQIALHELSHIRTLRCLCPCMLVCGALPPLVISGNTQRVAHSFIRSFQQSVNCVKIVSILHLRLLCLPGRSTVHVAATSAVRHARRQEHL